MVETSNDNHQEEKTPLATSIKSSSKMYLAILFATFAGLLMFYFYVRYRHEMNL